MKFPYIVNKDGIWYPAGTEVPADTVDSEKKYTKTEINRMSASDLQNLAREEGIEDAESKNGSELKKVLIQFYGL